MPVAPSYVQDILNKVVRSQTVMTILATIDRRMSDPGYIVEWAQDVKTNPTFQFAFRTSCSDAECSEIRRAYLEVGWGSVDVTNLAQGVGGYVCSVTIKTYPTRNSKLVICLRAVEQQQQLQGV